MVSSFQGYLSHMSSYIPPKRQRKTQIRKSSQDMCPLIKKGGFLPNDNSVTIHINIDIRTEDKIGEEEKEERFSMSFKQGDDPREVARSFCIENNLGYESIPLLEEHIKSSLLAIHEEGKGRNIPLRYGKDYCTENKKGDYINEELDMQKDNVPNKVPETGDKTHEENTGNANLTSERNRIISSRNKIYDLREPNSEEEQSMNKVWIEEDGASKKGTQVSMEEDLSSQNPEILHKLSELEKILKKYGTNGNPEEDLKEISRLSKQISIAEKCLAVRRRKTKQDKQFELTTELLKPSTIRQQKNQFHFDRTALEDIKDQLNESISPNMEMETLDSIQRKLTVEMQSMRQKDYLDHMDYQNKILKKQGKDYGDDVTNICKSKKFENISGRFSSIPPAKGAKIVPNTFYRNKITQKHYLTLLNKIV